MVDYINSNSTLVCGNYLSLGLLHIDLTSLAPNCINYMPIDEIPDPTEFAVLKARLRDGPCGTAIVDLFEKSKVLCIYFPEQTLNFLYFENKQVISVKRLDLHQQLFTCGIVEVTNCYFISELAMMVVLPIKRMLLIINLKECKVTRMFDLEIPHDDWSFSFNFSKIFQKLTVKCHLQTYRTYYDYFNGAWTKIEIILVFDLCDKFLQFKKLPIGLLKKHYSIHIKKLSVPQSLKKEILDEINDLLNFRIFYIFHIIFFWS